MALSVASSTTVGVSLGVGGSIAIGQLLNPLDRLIDDFSDWLLMGATAACATELLVQIDAQLGPGPGAVILLLLGAGALLFGSRGSASTTGDRVSSFLRGAFALLVLIRIGLPVAMVGADEGYKAFLAPRYDKAYATLGEIRSKTKMVYEAAMAARNDEEHGWLRGLLDKASTRMDALSASSAVLMERYDNFFEAVFTMAAILALRIFGLPILLGWFFWQGVKRFSHALAQ